MDVIAFILFLVVAASCAWIAECLIPGLVPGGFLVTAIVGVIGAWIGGTLVGHFGPELESVSLVPTIIGSAILVFGLAVLSRGFRGMQQA